ncbi:hypothetical protein [Streptomyces globisporus]|uniref:hypothetical protein n=1 Tax=Streptomyces globisporus TaxID=1908 RepID=UPI00068AC0D0|nr:hypothetical protein [Streptomyces globisporus]
MGRREKRRKVFEPLRRAGLEVLEGGVPEPVLPVFAVGVTAGCGKETGRRDSYVDFEEPDLIEHANRGWYELATSSGLFGATREFLLALPAHRYNPRVDLERRSTWHRVRLLDEWDVMGAACAIRRGRSVLGFDECLLGSRAGRPEFGMLSLDSSVSLVGTTWQHGIGSFVVPDPGSTQAVRRILDWAADGPDSTPGKRAAALAWLRRSESTMAERS